MLISAAEFEAPTAWWHFNKSFHFLAPFKVTLVFSDQGYEYFKII